MGGTGVICPIIYRNNSTINLVISGLDAHNDAVALETIRVDHTPS